ncbi:transketolase [Brevibacillus choshinensis]|uniref:Transketolase n=1 Tax=Brevibacillus choshinensis TaxID=54911 RepID=A0ABR5NEF4_BRECH|nr:transketolase family protein [Brevibacillus choshinensis]KQL49766.1 transketolase [Brevibacillus choshinensis]
MAEVKLAQQISMRDVFGEKLLALSRQDERIVALDGDLANSTKLDKIAENNPEQFLQMGIAEQNMLGVAAGLATVGFQPWVCSFAAFVVKRALDQITVSIAQPKLNVKMVGAYSGLLNGCTGKSHQSLEDMAIMRSLANMIVLAPADAVELDRMMAFANEYDGPVYIRVARDPLPVIFDSASYRFELGKGIQMRRGTDVTLIATGTQTHRAIEAAVMMEKEGVSAGVLHIPSIKPIDVAAIVTAAEKTKAIVTVEEHTIYGGLGGAVAEVLGEHAPVPLERIGVRDKNGESGSNDALLQKYGLTPWHIVDGVRRVLGRKKG